MGIENDIHSDGQLPLIATAALKTEYSNPISESNSANIPMQPIVESRDAATMSPCNSICSYAVDLANSNSLVVNPSDEEGGRSQKLLPADRSDATEQRDEPELPPVAVAGTSTASMKSKLSCDSGSEPRVTLITVTSKDECALDIQGVGSSYSVETALPKEQATTPVPETATRSEEKTTQVEETPADESEINAAMSIEIKMMLLEEKLSLLEETSTGAEEKTARAEEKTTQVEETPDESEVNAAMSIETKMMLLEEKINLLERKMMIAEVESKPDLPVVAETDIEPHKEVEPGSSNEAGGKKKKKFGFFSKKNLPPMPKIHVSPHHHTREKSIKTEARPEAVEEKLVEEVTEPAAQDKTLLKEKAILLDVERKSSSEGGAFSTGSEVKAVISTEEKAQFLEEGIKSGSPAKSGLEVEPFDEEKELETESVSANKLRLLSKPTFGTPMSSRCLPILSSFNKPSTKEMLCRLPSLFSLSTPRLGKNSDRTVSAADDMQSKDTKEAQMETIGLGDDEKLVSPLLQPAVDTIESNSMQVSGLFSRLPLCLHKTTY